MSYGLHVFCVEALTASQLADVIAGIDGLRTDLTREPAAHHLIERAVRGTYDPLATVDGPLRVEAEDLPDAVRAAAVGITTTYELNCPGSPAIGVRLTNQVARGIAAAGHGVVYDPQEDAVTWPRGGARKFKASEERRIEVVDLRWYVRREDRADDLPGIVFDTLASILPETLPRRFGGFEPLQFKLEEEGRSGFVREWRAESMTLHWKTKLPCLSGHVSGLGAPFVMLDPPAHPVGSVELSFHREALSDERWRRDVLRLFIAMIERTRAFFALSDVERNVGYGGGNLSYAHDVTTSPGLVVRDEWLGLPPHAFWLAWIGPLYLDRLADALRARPRGEAVGRGWLLRSGEEPPEESPAPEPGSCIFPPELVMRTGLMGPWGMWERERAAQVPEGL